MKTLKIQIAQLLFILFISSCNNTPPQQKETKDTLVNTSLDTSQKPIIAKPITDTTKKNELNITAMFVDFSLGDASHYTFKDKAGKVWDFADCKDKKFSFGVELTASKANEENQGWISNKNLQGKWFELTYVYITQPQYQDGPMAKMPVITKAILKL
jgi:hypothetical protein